MRRRARESEQGVFVSTSRCLFFFFFRFAAFLNESKSSHGKETRGAVLSLLVAAALLFSQSSPSPPHLLEDVVDERVEDRHGLGRDAGVGVHLLEDLVDVDLVRLVLGLDALLGAALGDLLGGLLSSSLGSHCGKF